MLFTFSMAPMAPVLGSAVCLSIGAPVLWAYLALLSLIRNRRDPSGYTTIQEWLSRQYLVRRWLRNSSSCFTRLSAPELESVGMAITVWETNMFRITYNNFGQNYYSFYLCT